MSVHNASVSDEEKGLNRTQTAVTMSPELFEKVPHIGNNIKRFANPTPLGFMGFVIAGFSFSMILMGWGGSSGGSPIVGIFFFGAFLLYMGMIGEWVIGNFFSMMVMGMFGTFWLSFGLLQLPTLNLGAAYATDVDPTGTGSTAWNAGLGLFLLAWGFAVFTLGVFTIKINVVFVLIFVLIDAFAFTMSGCYWRASLGDFETAARLQKAAGALLFSAAVFGWYITTIIIAGEMRFPLPLPVGDLSHLWPDTNLELADEKRE
ncbi:plasma membrane protein [Ophiostoma piceae UAMH 11346]|uniref:Plasma membrane protein n=1 Tax=Ophiostoma piceae (strain UAMH 11346) TaxID=1262450 RepID=S3C533_OPHP1|nr:plasma membrane protein [Ophiostoma piceae UAMH 11346]